MKKRFALLLAAALAGSAPLAGAEPPASAPAAGAASRPATGLDPKATLQAWTEKAGTWETADVLAIYEAKTDEEKQFVREIAPPMLAIAKLQALARAKWGK